MFVRYHIRPSRDGFAVYDIWTGEPVCVALTPQTGLSRIDAEELKRLMNLRAQAGDRVLHQ